MVPRETFHVIISLLIISFATGTCKSCALYVWRESKIERVTVFLKLNVLFIGGVYSILYDECALTYVDFLDSLCLLYSPPLLFISSYVLFVCLSFLIFPESAVKVLRSLLYLLRNNAFLIVS